MDTLRSRELLHRIEESQRTAGGERHAEEYGRANAEDYLGEADGGFAAADPRGAHDRLPRVFEYFAALRGFVLHTPLADLLAEGKAGKLAAAANAICHGVSVKEYQQFAAEDKARRIVLFQFAACGEAVELRLTGQPRAAVPTGGFRGCGSAYPVHRAATGRRPLRLRFSGDCKFQGRRSRRPCADAAEPAWRSGSLSAAATTGEA